MRWLVLAVLVLVVVLASVSVYDALESGANLIEILLLPATTDRTAAGALVVGGPFILLFAAVAAVRFVGVPLVLALAVSGLGGWGLRKSGCPISRRTAWTWTAIAGACAAALALFILQPGVFRSSPGPKTPRTPAGVLAFLAGANAALSVYAGTRVLRGLAGSVPADR